METLMLLTKIFGISFTSGINLYATVALVGLAVRFGFVGNLPEQLNVLGNEYVIGTALVLYICEFFADKIPAFDSFWDSFHTFIRPFAAAMLALMAAGESPLWVKVVAVLIAGSVALTSHTAKAGIRLVANTSPEPFSNSILSIAEDIGVFALVMLIITHPYIAAVIIFCLLALIVWQGPKFIALLVFILRVMVERVYSFIPSKEYVSVEVMQEKFDKYLYSILNESEQVYLTVESVFKADKKGSGYLIVCSKRVMLLYKSWFSVKHFEYEISDIKRLQFKRGLMVDNIIFIHNNKQKRITLFKNSARNIDDIRNIFRSCGADIVESVPVSSLSESNIYQ
ncbi:MAG: DUF4126 family protein [Vampirovibrionia bacterium]